MGEPFDLPPAVRGASYTFVVTAEEQPYVERWYLAGRRDETETIEAYIRRVVLRQSLRGRAGTLVESEADATRVRIEAEHATREQYEADTRTAAETKAALWGAT